MINFEIVLVNYANSLYSQSQKKNSKTGLEQGGFSKVFSYGPKDIDQDFYIKNRRILNQKKGNGYWLWKPYFIKKALEKLNFGDHLFYCDSGSYFIDSIKNLILLSDLDQDMMVFELPFLEKQYTKRDTFVLMGCDSERYSNSNQILGGYCLWKKSDFTIKFVDDWLKYAQDERIITDNKNECGLPDYDAFIAHRHDQSIFSLLCKKNSLKVHRDPSQFGNESIANYNNSKYQQLLVLTRQKKIGFSLSTFFYILYLFKTKLIKMINE
jgi:hypothetical protein